ncbi:MAG: toxin-antitoxin system protein [Chloroflexi bacterium]|nr:toxin-antitoxin system protein [Chloroflexota bacterium]
MMSTTTVRISEAARETLRALAAQMGEPMQRVLEKAIEEYRRRQFFEEVNAAYAALRSDPEAWEEELAERRLLEGTLTDDLEAR